MKKLFLSGGVWLLVSGSFAQTVTQNLQKAFKAFETDPQLKYAISSLYVVDANSGNVVFDKNSQVGLAPASTQKIITAATAFELLGKDYRYKTELILNKLNPAKLILLIKGSGDPTLGSSRYSTTSDSLIITKWVNAIRKKNINGLLAGIRVDDITTGNISTIPDGYIWQDIGNYYGAGWSWVNWRENQYDISFKSGDPGYPVSILDIYPKQDQVHFANLVRAGRQGSGDSAYIYCAPYSKEALIKGTIPPHQQRFTISGAMPDPGFTLGITLRDSLLAKAVQIDSNVFTLRTKDVNDGYVPSYENIEGSVHYSPSLDSIVYWFLKKSINLYGEALLNTLSIQNESKVQIIKDFWKEKGIDENELNIGDGSGLSPGNRVTTHAQVEILKYAKKRPWFSYFYDALPEYNGMKMKSGTVKNVKAYCGYHKAANGKEYIFSFLVNNYNGSSSELIGKMYRVLNHLK